ncbi:MAG: DNA polymerase III subunit delta [Puniceicoccaceae bacterium]|nr:MAG: DNA polymerase III subunit delta [Puniceicoccaceae bacterium]
MAGKPLFTYICGPDDYLVARRGAEAYVALAATVEDDFSKEILEADALTVADVEAVVNRFRSAVQTMGLFGGRRVLWLKGVTFLADTVLGRAEGTLKQVEALQEILAGLNPEEVGVVITANPVDRRRSFPKWCEKHSDFHLEGETKRGQPPAWAEVVKEECAALGIRLTPGALERLAGLTQGNTRLMVLELDKLASHRDGKDGPVEEEEVLALVPAFGQGDFFEATEAFFSGNVAWALDAVRRHFFAGHDVRPLLTSLQNRNRLRIQLRALMDAGALPGGPGRSLEPSLAKAAERFGSFFDPREDKSSHHLFSQSPWYLRRLAGEGELPRLRTLIEHQQAMVDAFEEILGRADEAESVIRGLILRCLGSEATS